MYVKNNEIISFDSSGVEYVPEETEKIFKGTIEHKNRKINLFRIKANNSMFGHICIAFIDFMFAGKTLVSITLVCFLLTTLKRMMM